MLRFLELIVSSAKGKLDDYILESGGIWSLVWDGTAEEISFYINRLAIGEKLDKNQECIAYGVQLAKDGLHYFVDSELLLHSYHFFKLPSDDPKSEEEYGIKLIDRDKDRALFLDACNNENTIQDFTNIETFLSIYPETFPAHNETITKLKKTFFNWAIYHDLDVTAKSEIRQAIITRYEKTLSFDGENLINVLHTLYTRGPEF